MLLFWAYFNLAKTFSAVPSARIWGVFCIGPGFAPSQRRQPQGQHLFLQRAQVVAAQSQVQGQVPGTVQKAAPLDMGLPGMIQSAALFQDGLAQTAQFVV